MADGRKDLRPLPLLWVLLSGRIGGSPRLWESLALVYEVVVAYPSEYMPRCVLFMKLKQRRLAPFWVWQDRPMAEAVSV